MDKERFQKLYKGVISFLCAGIIFTTSIALPGYAKTPDSITASVSKDAIGTTPGKDIGILGIGFSYDSKQNIYYASKDCWQRSFGYSTFYDDMAPLFNMHFYCERHYFTYNGKNWLIEIWKGQYGITTGAEIGVYYKSNDRNIKHYDCVSDKDSLVASMTLYHNDKKMFTRPAQKSWWLTGFVLGPQIMPSKLTLNYTITFKDKTMLEAFKKTVGKDCKTKFTYKNLTATGVWKADK